MPWMIAPVAGGGLGFWEEFGGSEEEESAISEGVGEVVVVQAMEVMKPDVCQEG